MPMAGVLGGWRGYWAAWMIFGAARMSLIAGIGLSGIFGLAMPT
jgi:hypothetical protein